MDKLEIYERAWRRKGGDRLPKKQPIERLDNLILLTEENRKEYIRLGAIIWVIKTHYNKQYYDVVSQITIYPCLKIGWLYIKGDPLSKEVMVIEVFNNENKKEWARGYKEVLDYGIEQKNLYYDQNHPNAKYKFSATRLTK